MGLILVADTDAGRRAATEALLARLGHDVEGVDGVIATLTFVRERSPSLVVLDVGTGGLELCREIIEGSGRTAVILIWPVSSSASERVAGLLAGADDCLGRSIDPDELLARARRTIARATEAARPTFASTPTLTLREREVLGLLAQGLTQREIASSLVISHKTVGTHVQHILSKLGLTSRAQAVAYAFRHDDELVPASSSR